MRALPILAFVLLAIPTALTAQEYPNAPTYATTPSGHGDPESVVCRAPQPLPSGGMGPRICLRNVIWVRLTRTAQDLSADGKSVFDRPNVANPTGEGNPDADLVCVGEAPGQTEDETGRPFVGQAGQLLTRILAAINLAREDVFIVNVLKHRPPGNRNPRPEEVEACSPYLVRQLELIRPKVIVAFGTFAAQTLLNTKLPIGQLRAKVHRYYGTPLVATYHPAALLRNPAWKRPTWEDVQLARRILDRATGA